ncbi:hypothetical protein, partial [Salmonella sp. SAL4457]|uniref:hypothetical protein n=1 Tax=Salmonella sp. SAL4457 TaxID=3159912 RepID=UPI00397882D0
NPGKVIVDDAASPTQGILRTNDGFAIPTKKITQSFMNDAVAHIIRTEHLGLIWSAESAALGVEPPKADQISPRIEFTDRDPSPELLYS